jgi:TolB-like protein
MKAKVAAAAVSALAFSSLLAGQPLCEAPSCSGSPLYAPTPARVVAPTTDLVTPREATFQPLVRHHSRSTAGRFNASVIFLADQLERNLERRSPGALFIVTSLAHLDNLEQTSGLGRLIAEQLIHELTIRRWQLIDLRMSRDIAIKESGEFSLTRDITRIREETRASGLVTGTIAVAGGHVLVSVRVVDVASGVVLSTAQTRFDMDPLIAHLVDTQERNVPIRVVPR